MNERRRLPNKRLAVTFDFFHGHFGNQPLPYLLTVGFFARPAGRAAPILDDVAEIFLNSTMKLGTDVDINMQDAAVGVSLALQYGCPLETLRVAMKRNADGSPQGVLGHALDLVAKDLQ